MKKLLLTLGAVASVAAPVAAVVACGSTEGKSQLDLTKEVYIAAVNKNVTDAAVKTDLISKIKVAKDLEALSALLKSETALKTAVDAAEPTLTTKLDTGEVETFKNGADVHHAFVDHLTFGELFNRAPTFISDAAFTTFKDAADAFDKALNGAEAGSKGASTREAAIETFVTAVNAFNDAELTLAAGFKSTSNGEKTLFDTYKSKKIKAVLFYQDADDAKDQSGEATLVLSAKGEDWTNADNDWNEMADKAKGFDETNAGHSITGDNFSVRFDIVA